jgi:hypothetical protein
MLLFRISYAEQIVPLSPYSLLGFYQKQKSRLRTSNKYQIYINIFICFGFISFRFLLCYGMTIHNDK